MFIYDGLIGQLQVPLLRVTLQTACPTGTVRDSSTGKCAAPPPPRSCSYSQPPPNLRTIAQRALRSGDPLAIRIAAENFGGAYVAVRQVLVDAACLLEGS